MSCKFRWLRGSQDDLRRIIELAGVADIRGIEDVNDRTIAATLALNIATALIKGRRFMQSINAVIEIAASS